MGDGDSHYVDFTVLLENPDGSTWGDCTGIAFPQFVAACAGASTLTWNPTGTSLYASGNAGDWQALVRIDVDNRDDADALLPLSAWAFNAPALVFAGLRSGSTTQYYEPTGGLIRPKANPSDPEFTTLRYIARAGQQSFRVNAVFSTPTCASKRIPTPRRPAVSGSNASIRVSTRATSSGRKRGRARMR